ncbi:MAG: hypothetical protein ACOCYU_03825, partial [Brevefilum sp.]
MCNASNHSKSFDLHFDEEIEVTQAGFSFQPIHGFELEIDETVYMYSDNGNVEIYLVGGELGEDQSIAEMNDDLAAEFMENVGDYDLFDAGTDQIGGITGFLNEIRFSNAEEDGLGYCLICSPYINQYFFILVITNAEYWKSKSASLWKALKTTIHFHPQYRIEIIEQVKKHHPDLTSETYEGIQPGEEFILTIEKGDASLLLAARSYAIEDKVSINEITSPEGETLYRFNPQTGEFFSTISDQEITGSHGEVCFFYPRDNRQVLKPGDYRFSFSTSSGDGLQEVQFIIRSGRALGLQKIDLNFWLAMNGSRILDQSEQNQLTDQIYHALKERLAPFNLSPGRVDFIHPAPDELDSFSVINLDSDLADCSYMIAESVANDRALNIGMVDKIYQGEPPQPSTVKAVSSGAPGMILASGSPHACILIQWPEFIEDPHSLAEAIIQQLIIFSGIETKDIDQLDHGPELILNREIAWRLRRHPLFYDAE